MARLTIAVLISGRGTNLQALIDACAEADFPAQIVCVVCNVPGAGGIARAEAAGIDTRVLNHRDYPDRESFEGDLHAVLTESATELVCLAGFMRLLTETFVERWSDRMINIHPSLLPAYKGLNTHQRAIDDGVRITGCTVHFVRPAMDTGPIIAQAATPIAAGDDADRLAARVLEAEHRGYKMALRLIAEGRVAIRDERVVIAGHEAPGAMLINPDDAETGSGRRRSAL